MRSTGNLPYLSRQPFPENVAVSLEGETRLDSATFEGLRTLELKPFLTLREILEKYLGNYATDPAGAALGIQGAYGSGKTHLLTYLLKIAWRHVAAPQAVYVKAEGSDFLALYKRIIQDMKVEPLRQAKTRWFSRLAQTEASESKGSKSAVAVLKEDPNTVYNYLNRGMLSSERIEGVYQEKVRDVAKLDDFLHALAYLNDPLLGNEACRWFQGEILDANTLKKLGVKEPVNTIEKALLALRFLVTLFREAEQPFLLFIDQIERLVLDVATQAREANLGNLHSLLEVFKRERGFICLAGVTQAWKSLPDDFDDRLETPPVTLPSLRLDDTLDLLKVYLSETDKFTPYQSEAEIYPFTESAAREMVRSANGNMRRILRLAYRSFEEAARDKLVIDDVLIKRVSQRVDIFFDEKSIHDEIVRMLRESNIPFEGMPTRGGFTDLAVPDAKAPRALIEITKAAFTVDEARRAVGFLQNAAGFRQRFPHAQLILVVAGYLSLEVQQDLKSVVNHYQVYDPNSFHEDFRDILEALKAPPAGEAAPSGELKQLLAQMQELRGSLNQVLDQRQQAATRLDTNLQGFSDYQLALENKRGEIELEERGRISESKAAKDAADKEERERLRQLGEEERRRRRNITIGLSVIMGLIMPAGLISSILPSLFEYTFSYILSLFGTRILLALGMGIFVSLFISIAILQRELYATPFIQRASKTVPDLKFLDQDAVRLGRNWRNRPTIIITYLFGDTRPSSASFSAALRDPNPQVRYLAARAAFYQPRAVDLDWLLRALNAETWLPAQAALLRALVSWVEQGLEQPPGAWGNQVRKGLTDVLSELGDYLKRCTDKEAVYALDAVQQLLRLKRQESDTEDLDRIFDDIVEKLAARQDFVAVQALLSGVFRIDPMLQLVRGEFWGNPDQTQNFVLYFSAFLRTWRYFEREIYSGEEKEVKSLSGDRARRRMRMRFLKLVDLFQHKNDPATYPSDVLGRGEETDYDRGLRELLKGLSAETLKNASLLFDHGDEESLGFYEDLQNAALYADLYKFFLEARIVLEQEKVRARYA